MHLHKLNLYPRTCCHTYTHPPQHRAIHRMHIYICDLIQKVIYGYDFVRMMIQELSATDANGDDHAGVTKVFWWYFIVGAKYCITEPATNCITTIYANEINDWIDQSYVHSVNQHPSWSSQQVTTHLSVGWAKEFMLQVPETLTLTLRGSRDPDAWMNATLCNNSLRTKNLNPDPISNIPIPFHRMPTSAIVVCAYALILCWYYCEVVVLMIEEIKWLFQIHAGLRNM